MEVPWENNVKSCVLFLMWLDAIELPLSYFTPDCMMLFLQCCAYFQVSEECWECVQQRIILPASWRDLPKDVKAIWSRSIIPFSVVSRIIVSTSDKLQRVLFLFAWFSESSVTTSSDKQALETCEDFFLMRELAIAILAPASGLKLVPSQLVQASDRLLDCSGKALTLTTLLEALAQFPIAANCLGSVWVLQLNRMVTSNRF